MTFPPQRRLSPTRPGPRRMLALDPVLLLLLLLLLAAALSPCGARAQAPPPAPAAGSGSPAAPAAESNTQTLIDVLRDDEARAALIDRLRTATGAPPADPTAPAVAEPGPAATTGATTGAATGAAATGAPTGSAAGPTAAADASKPAEERPLIADQLAERMTGLIRRIERDLRADWVGIRATVRRLGGLADLDRDAARAFLPEFLLLTLAGLGAAFIGRVLLLPVFRRLGVAAAEGGLLRKTGLALAAIAIDAANVIVALLVALVFSSWLSPPEADAEHRLHFLGAFLLSGLLIVVVRALFSPSTPLMRPLPMTDATAWSWTRHLSLVIVLVVFGELFLAPLISELASPITARAVLVTVYIVTLLYLIVLVLVKRKAPAEYFRSRAAEAPDDVGLMLLAGVAPYWHFLAIPYLLYLGNQAVTTSQAGLPLLIGSARLAGLFGLALLAVGLLNRLADRGLHLSPRVASAFPTMETRLNVFVPPFLRLLRYVVAAIWLGLALEALGAVEVGGMIQRRLGVDLVATITSVVLVVVIGFGAWLLLSSWIDYRLVPHHGREPTARERTLLELVRNVGLIAILLLGLTYGLSEIGLSVAPLLASAGVVGLAIGFGSQKLVQDIINGLFIQFENAINVGDVVEVAGRTGSVEKLTIRSVSLRDVEGVFHVIPFSSVDSVSNYMKGFSFHVADINVAYREDIDAAKAAMLAAYDDLMADITWETKLVGGLEWFGVQALSPSSMVLRARLKTRPGEQWAIGRAYTEIVKKRLDAAGIEIPFPQQTVWFGQRRDGDASPARIMLEIQRPRTATRAAPEREVASRQTRADGSPTDADGDGDEG